jgi:hypothetical protein
MGISKERKMSTETQARDHLLPGAVVGRAWQTIPIDDPASKPPEEWVKGLWGLDAAVRAAIRGGWTDDEITHEVGQLVRSHREEAPGA